MRLLYFSPFLLALSLILAGIVYWRMDPTSRPPLPVMGLRWFLGVLFVFSGLAKLIPGFPNTMGPADLESTLAPYHLAEYARFIAASELGIGLMLLTRRFATLGALFLAALLIALGSIRIARENTIGMLVVAVLVFGLAMLDWRQDRSAS